MDTEKTGLTVEQFVAMMKVLNIETTVEAARAKILAVDANGDFSILITYCTS